MILRANDSVSDAIGQKTSDLREIDVVSDFANDVHHGEHAFIRSTNS